MSGNELNGGGMDGSRPRTRTVWMSNVQSTSSPRPVHPPRPLRFWALLAGIVLLGGGTATFLLTRRAPEVNHVDTPDPVKSEKPQKPSRPSERPAPRAAKPTPMPTAQTTAQAPAQEDVWQGRKVERRIVETNGTTVVETIYTDDGKCHQYYRKTEKPVLDNASDQILALATAENHGGVLPPLPGVGPNFKYAFAESLKKEIVVNEDDPDAVKALKERVKQARQEMLEAIAQGMTAEEVLAEHRKMQEHNASMRMEAVKGLREYLDKGDAEGAKAYCAKVNEALDGMGMMRIELPRSQEEVIAERRARNAERRETNQQTEKKE